MLSSGAFFSRHRPRSAGIYLIEQGREEERGRLVSRIREAAGRRESLSSGEVEAAVRELRGYRAWKAGRLEEAARL